VSNNHIIKISVVNGTIVCDREHVKFYHNVEWECDQGHTFAVDFGWNSPFSQTSYVGKKQAGSAISKTPGGMKRINANASHVGYPLRFKYTVAIYLSPTDEILISDPEVIIDP